MTPIPAWFSKEEAAGLADFWAVYLEHYDALTVSGMDAVRAEPTLAPLVAAMTPEQIAANSRDGLERIKKLIAGDWTEYIHTAQVQGVMYAQLGISFTTWYRLVRVVSRDITPLLVKTYSNEPTRLAGALVAMQSFFDWALAMLGEVYLSTKQAALEKSERRVRRFVEAGLLGVVELDEKNVITEANDVFLGMVRQTRDVVGKLQWGALTAPEFATIAAMAQQELERTGIARLHEKEFVRGDGSRIPVLVAAATLDEGRRVAFALDITPQKQAETLKVRSLQLESENRRIQEANRLKSEFLANMSHELRTPLNAIIGFAELLHDGQVPHDAPQFKEFLSDILTSGRHLLQLINDVLDLSKVEAGKTEFHPEPVDPRTLINEVVAILRTPAANKRIRVSIDVDPALISVFVDPGRLKQVLYNFVSNALKFTPENGRISIRARPEGDAQFKLEVEDTGIGIAATDLGKLFREFQQLDAGAAKKHQGTGLGLALTRRLAEAQGGSVAVSSVPGTGSVFSATLPRRAGGESRPKPKRITEPSVAPVVLVIEDDARDQALIVKTLSEAGYQCETASSAAQAIARSAERSFDAITLDLLLPDATGLEVLGAIRAGERNRNVPVIVITVVTTGGAAAGFAVHDMLAKPLEDGALLASLQRASVKPERGGRVLVVDDDASSARLMRAALEQLGYEVVTALNGDSGLKAAKEKPPRAVILDLLMPVMDGFEFLDQFRNVLGCQQVPVVVWTAKDLTPSDRRWLEVSVQGVLQKGKDAGGAVLEALTTFLPARRTT
ncbi:MAG: response regulator [Archangium sp.]|nr:response regulator [Archangium sp.]